jgi:hypothetical protein
MFERSTSGTHLGTHPAPTRLVTQSFPQDKDAGSRPVLDVSPLFNNCCLRTLCGFLMSFPGTVANHLQLALGDAQAGVEAAQPQPWVQIHFQIHSAATGPPGSRVGPGVEVSVGLGAAWIAYVFLVATAQILRYPIAQSVEGLRDIRSTVSASHHRLRVQRGST